MKISGFSYIRNGFDYGVPFLEAYRSILPICDEFIVAVGDSKDGTREAIANLDPGKIVIIDTVWDMKDMNLRVEGKIFAQQSNLALDAITGDWAFHIQADEVIHENDIFKIKEAIEKYDDDKETEGFILPFIHFWGGYNYIRTSRRVHMHEVRLFRNGLNVRSYRDSQGFRKFESFDAYESGTEKGKKLHVRKIDAPIYHYTAVKGPKGNFKKAATIGSFYVQTPQPDEVQLPQQEILMETFGFDRLEKFTGTHPKLMSEKVNSQDWIFEFDKKKAVWRKKDRIMQPIEDILGFKIGEYKNYKLIK